MNVVFLDRATLPPGIVVRQPNFEHTFRTFDRTRPEDIAGRIAKAHIVITNKVRLPAAVIAAAPQLEMIAVAATGYDMVDVAACVARGIVVSNIQGYAQTSVPEHVFAMIFALRRNLIAYRQAVIAGRWQEADQFSFFDYPIADLAGSTLGVVGQGSLGKQVCHLGRALGMKVLVGARKSAAPSPLRTSFEELLAKSDVISLHCPLTSETLGMISDPEFEAMARRPLLINTARGGLVDEAALERALDQGRISGAGLDVASAEPPPVDHPFMRLAHRQNVIITPHVAWASQEAAQRLADQLIDNIEAFVAGSPQNRVA
jgi:glycerate dehydrogenase